MVDGEEQLPHPELLEPVAAALYQGDATGWARDVLTPTWDAEDTARSALRTL